MNLTSEEDFDFISETSERMNTLYGTDISWEKNDEEFGSFLVTNMTYDSLSDLDL